MEVAIAICAVERMLGDDDESKKAIKQPLEDEAQVAKVWFTPV